MSQFQRDVDQVLEEVIEDFLEWQNRHVAFQNLATRIGYTVTPREVLERHERTLGDVTSKEHLETCDYIADRISEAQAFLTRRLVEKAYGGFQIPDSQWAKTDTDEFR